MRRAVVELGGAALLLALALAVCGEGLHRPYVGNDFDSQNLPYRAWFARGLAHNEVRLWCPEIGCGYPLVAEAEVGAAYAGNAAFLCWRSAPWWALTATLIAHLWLAGLGVRWHLRLLGAGPLAATAGGLAYLLSGPLIAREIHLNFFEGLCWLPWLLAATEAGLQGRRRGWLGVATSVGLMGLAGHVHPLLMAGLLAPLYLLARRPTVRQAGAFVVAFAVGGLLGAVVYLPLFELLGQSARASASPLAGRLGGSLTPLGLSSLLLPSWFGPPLGAGDEPLRRLGLVVPHEWCAYLGALPLLGLAAAPWLGRRRERWLFFALALLGLVLAMGQTFGLYSLLARLPVWSKVRVPGRLVVVWAWGAALSCGLLLDDLRVHGAPRGRPRLAVLATVWCGALGLSLAAWQLAQLAGPGGEDPRRIIGCLLCAALLLSLPLKPGRWWFGLLALVLVGLDGVTGLYDYHTHAAPAYYAAPPEVGRIQALGSQRVYAPSYCGGLQASRNLLYDGVPNAAMYGALAMPRLLNIEALLREGLTQGTPAGQRWLGLLRIGWSETGITSGEDHGRTHLTQLGVLPAPEAWFVPTVQAVANEAASLAAVSQPDWQPSSVAYVEGQPLPCAVGEPEMLTLARPSRNRLVVSAPPVTGGAVVVGEAFGLGWQVQTADGPRPARVVDHLLLGAGVTAAGPVRFVYRPLSIRLGLWLSLLACGIITAWWVVTRED